MSPGSILICLGNEFRQDDGLGPYIARHSTILGLEGLKVVENSGDCIELMEVWKRENRVILVDAVRSGRPPGTIFQITNWTTFETSDAIPFSSHAVGLSDCISLSRMLGSLPQSVHFFGVEGKDFGYGNTLSGEVKKSAEKILVEIAKMSRLGPF